MKTIRVLALLLLGLGLAAQAEAQMRPPMFAGGVPGLAQTRAMLLQRHQARTLLYREALEELRKNPAAADLPACAATVSGPCLTPPPSSPAATAQTKPVAEAVAPPPAPAAGRRLALLVGNNQYLTPIPALETPIADVDKIAQVLRQRFGYEAKVITNAGQAAIIDALNGVAKDARAEDSVLLFYAGHGYLMEDIGMGFWIPSDASTKTAKGWISNNDIAKLLTAIAARQMILISDSCYSGTLTKETKLDVTADSSPEEILKRRSVLVLSSGGDEPVSDEGKDGHSIFAWNLIKTLEKTGGMTPGARVWKTVHGGVTKDYPQEPQYGAVVSAGHDAGGEYLFTPR